MSGSSHTDVILAGALAAFTVDLMIYPLDTLKTRQQSRDFLKTFTDSSTKTRLPPRHLFKGLYQGIGIVVVSTLPAAGAFFTVYEASKSLLGKHSSSLHLPQPLVHSGASAIAECASCLVLTPAEVIKQNAQMLQSHGSRDTGGSNPAPSKSTSLQALRQLGGTGAGPRLLSGYTALVARNLPFTAIQFPIFESLREWIWARRPRVGDGDGARSLLETGIVTGTSAGLAGSFAAFITTPMDVVKTRMMLSAGSRDESDAKQASKDGMEKSRGTNRSRGGLVVAREVIAQRGIAGLFRGAALRSVWTTVGSGLYLGMYEVAKTWLARGKGDDDNSFP
ncbi:mitochondrial carrier domain-containing protein [Poronia punctata]|nr:mitochondrial carrier domain-containing protein [Poronia punctata]